MMPVLLKPALLVPLFKRFSLAYVANLSQFGVHNLTRPEIAIQICD
jgi:hypothetical protein